jgi:hypothetical protein
VVVDVPLCKLPPHGADRPRARRESGIVFEGSAQRTEIAALSG